MNKLTISQNKTLKLINVLKHKNLFQNGNSDMSALIDQMNSYIRVNGAMQIGPLIQYLKSDIDETGKMTMECQIMLQCNHPLTHVMFPYSMENIILVPNCMYCRYIGPKDKMNFAYDKIYLEAFEHDIKLRGDSYTIFVDENEEEEIVTVDIFMPKE